MEQQKNNNDTKKLEEIANQLGTTVQQLLENHGTPQQIIEKFNSGTLRILND